jgi:cation diffusion facilitator family transporter
MRAAAIASAKHAQITVRIAAISIAVAALLIGLKAWAWFNSQSVAMLASLANSTLDLAASLFAFFAVRYATNPPDREHRYGHGKAEAFAGLMQAGLVVMSAVLVGVEAVRRAFHPTPVSYVDESLMVMAASILLTGALVVLKTDALKQIGSVATQGDRLHHARDLAANAVVMAGIGASAYFGWLWADAAAAFLVALWLIIGAARVGREASDHLLDREAPAETRARARELAGLDPNIRGVHAMRTRLNGPYMHIQFQADLDPALSLEQAHHIVVAAEDRIRAEFPKADIIIHLDPRGVVQPHGHADFPDRRDPQA